MRPLPCEVREGQGGVRAQQAKPDAAAMCFLLSEITATFSYMLKHRQPHPNPPQLRRGGADRGNNKLRLKLVSLTLAPLPKEEGLIQH